MTRITVRTLDGGETTVDDETLGRFTKQLEGSLLTPDDGEAFAEATTLWNGMIEKTPALVVQPVRTGDVQAAVDLAREHGLLLSVRGGGHNIAGTALADGGLTLDMSQMRDVEVDPEDRTARVGPGCLLGDVDEATQEHGLATALGFVSETGVAGLTLGGGFGYLTRSLGYTVDDLIEAEIVTADGQVRRASPGQNPDLFWGLRGGGHNLGVVTEFVFRLHEVGPTVTGGLRGFPAEDEAQARQALEVYRELTREAPRELTVFMLLRRAPPAPFVPEDWHGGRIAVFVICHVGGLEQAPQDLAPLSQLGDPIFDIVEPRPYTELQSLVDTTQPKGNRYYWKSEYTADLPDALLDTLGDLSLENPIPGGQLALAHIGGALNERPEDDGAVGNRDARYVAAAQAMWTPEDPEGEAYVRWTREAWRSFRPFSTGGNYVNFQTADEDETRVQGAYGDNLGRLAKVKASYDPDNLFRANRNVSPKE